MLVNQLQNAETLTDVEQTIASYFLNADHCAQKSAREVAKTLFVSASTITRFCQKYGYAGYPDFVKALDGEKQYLNTHFQEIDANRPFEKK